MSEVASADAAQEAASATAQEATETEAETASEATTETASAEAAQEATKDPELSKARREAAKYRTELRKAEAELEQRKTAELSENEQLKKQADDAATQVAAATDKLRKANVLSALADQHDLTGGKAKAAVRLLDGIEFNDDDEPTNLAEAVTAAKSAYGDEVFTVATAAKQTELPDLHAGARSESSAKPESTGWFPKLK